MREYDRRRFLSLLATGAATPFIMSMAGCGGSGGSGGGSRNVASKESQDTSNSRFQNLNFDSERVFSLSVASGDPSPTGVVLWTRVDPDSLVTGESLYVEVSEDAEFRNVIMELAVAPEELNEHRDYTVSLDLDGNLLAGTTYYYRFIYTNTASRTGRCKTAPAYGTNLASLKMAVVTCQDYTNGYYGALNAIASDDSLDYVIHLGDFIYETAGDERFQSLPFDDRRIELPSIEFPVAMDLEDYRKLYRTYRQDPFLQRAMEQHTWIITRDDHETGNDAYWDYDKETLGLPDHPFTLDTQFEANRLELLNQLMLDSQQAWLEYVPARVEFDMDSMDPHQRLKYYRHVQLGDLVDLFMLDGRTYRTPHPCGEDDVLQRYAPVINCQAWFKNQEQSMLGQQQFEWLVNGLADSTTRWQLLGNQTFMAPIWFGNGTTKGSRAPINVDAWDGFDFERDLLAKEIKAAGVEDLIVLTGDLHSYIASHVKLDYLNNDKEDADNFVAVEFMTPSVTSSGLIEMISTMVLKSDEIEPFWQNLITNASNLLIRQQNPHIDFFDSSHHGYSVVEFSHDYCDWKCYAIDKDINNGDQEPEMLRHFRKVKGHHLLQNLT
ncbi:MAG: alkaline phosphatase D family protein [Pseudomonadales bacterium]|nr:alkaline phosphatase D family protein [Pseudomonadales bacterium]